jgi:predicted SprT family Zn-dependent metalloprotease
MSSDETPWFEADYEDTCKQCRKHIYMSDTIRAVSNGPGYLCVVCGQQEPPRRTYNPLDSIG